MAGSSFGKSFVVTTFGESHGVALGAIVDGVPAGIELSEEDIQKFLDRRKPGQSTVTTSRNESDKCRIYSGVFGGKTTGTPIMVMLENQSQRSQDYDELAITYRPGHADFSFDSKYGFRDYRGGGRSSGRETIGRVIGGAIAIKALEMLGIKVQAFTQSIGNVYAENFNLEECSENDVYMPDNEAAAQAIELIKRAKEEKDSLGGIIGCIATGVMPGLGEPVFDKLDARLSAAVMSIGAIKGVEFGAGFHVSTMKGSQNNDPFFVDEDDTGLHIRKKTNMSGGILGGISDGSPIIINAAVKPTPSIAREQETVNAINEEVELEIKGRHDPVIVPRAVVVVESMVAITLFDMVLENMKSKMDNILKVYKDKI
jgi:chorismate synthase